MCDIDYSECPMPLTLGNDGQQWFVEKWMVTTPELIPALFEHMWQQCRCYSMGRLFLNIRWTIQTCELEPSDVEIAHRKVFRYLDRDEYGVEIPGQWVGKATVLIRKKEPLEA